MDLKNLILYISCIILIIPAYGQIDDVEPMDTTVYGDIVSIDASYGSIIYRRSHQYAVNSMENIRIGNPIQTIGLSLNVTYVRNYKHEYGMRLTFSQNIPQDLVLTTDSVSARISGANFSWHLVGAELTPNSKYSSILLGWGFSTGRVKVNSTDFTPRKNPYFSPAIFLDPKFFINHLSVTFSFGYQFDISKKKWNDVPLSNKKDPIELTPLRQTGLSIHGGLGWKF